jgi:predicted transposase YbfD/YdcC
MIKTTYNQNEDAYRLAELNYIRAVNASEEAKDKRLSNNIRNYAVIQKQTGQADDALENMLEKVYACRNSDFGKFVQEHSASIVKKVQEQNAAEQNRRGDFMKHYRLVNKIASGIDIE